jgi:hypothetical protein
VLAVKRHSTGFAATLAEKDHPPVVAPIEDVSEFKVRAIQPVPRWRNVEVIKNPREPTDVHRCIIEERWIDHEPTVRRGESSPFHGRRSVLFRT